MPVHHRAYSEVLHDRGVRFSLDEFVALAGGPARQTIPRLVGSELSQEEISAIHSRKIAHMEDVLQRMAPTVLEAARVLQAFEGLVPLGLVTSGSRATVGQLLSPLGWFERFSVIVCGDDVSEGKPSPEPYLAAAAGLGLQARECVAFEDSDDGVASAAAAGVPVFDVRLWVTRDDLAKR
jgi:HAD superfamily hydrolase (TIGR01509 family)